MVDSGANIVANKVFNPELFFELSPDLLCIAGYDGYFKRINPAVSRLLGYTENELFARPINDFVHPDDKVATAKGRHNLTKDIPLLNFENRYVCKNGDIVWLSWTSIPLESEQLVYAIAKDITHKKKVEESRDALIGDLTKINQDLKQLNYTASHDLRTPVGNLLSVFSLLDETKIQDEETLEFIGILRSATENLKNTLNSYVDTLIQKENKNTQSEELNLEESLNVVLKSLSSLIKSSGTEFCIDFSAIGHVKFNRAFLESIFLNLITNSIKYAKPDSRPEIAICSRKVNGTTQLVFADKGVGFDMNKVKDKIFGFHQTFNGDNDSKGIGLYLVHNHVTSLGGNISIKSKSGSGAEFIISFKD
ncbi:MAG TPA: PAS domain-containing sensor histidine kinase [Mucilaginibacter sp.]|nr:PAS domain-containing sensor histidine kinase [Mucilaginibacter sp.]